MQSDLVVARHELAYDTSSVVERERRLRSFLKLFSWTKRFVRDFIRRIRAVLFGPALLSRLRTVLYTVEWMRR